MTISKRLGLSLARKIHGRLSDVEQTVEMT